MKRYKRTLTISIACLIAAALSLSAIPLIQVREKSLGVYLVAGVFWIGLLVGLAAYILASVKFRKYRNRAYERGLLKPQPLPGILTFRRDPLRLVLYAILALGLICIVSDIIARWIPESVMFPILSITVIALVLHCVLDGRDYQAYAKMKEGTKNGRK